MSLLVATPGVRARAYLQAMVTSGLPPAEILVLGSSDDDPTEVAGAHDPIPAPWRLDETVRVTASRHNLPVREIATTNIHDPTVLEAVAATTQPLAIFTGGGILKPNLLATGPRWLHVHPGRLPDHRGSTCIYYSMLLEQTISASAFFMEPGLDVGAVVAQQTIPVPVAPTEAFDHGIDAWLRATVLIQALHKLAADPRFAGTPQPTAGQLFFIIHPVLKQLALDQVAVTPAKEVAHVHSS